MFILGFACQKGLIPVSVEAICSAIELNNVAVEFNLEAFHWGRHAAAHGDRVLKLAELPSPFKPLDDLPAIVEDRSNRLRAYHNEAYAQRFRNNIEKLRQAEETNNLMFGNELSKTAARSLYKLMAYKDEYEVARLYSDGNFQRSIDAQFEPGAKLHYHLAPPFLSFTDPAGRHRKIRFPGFSLWLLKLLAALRFLRGTPFDMFAYQADRKQERLAIMEFESLLEQITAHLNKTNYEIAVAMAKLPQNIRGYGVIKANACAAAQKRQRELLTKFLGQTEHTVIVKDKAA